MVSYNSVLFLRRYRQWERGEGAAVSGLFPVKEHE